MAIRKCEICERTMQEGYSIESERDYTLACTPCLGEAVDNVLGSEITIDFHDWKARELDDEDFEIMMNKSLYSESPHDLAHVLNLIHEFEPNKTLKAFIDYLNSQH